MAIKEGESKVVKCTYMSEYESVHGMLYSFNVEFEDGVRGLYNSKNKENPKFKIGEMGKYTCEEKPTKKDPSKTWCSIKSRTDTPYGGGSYQKREVPVFAFALDKARRMLNSSSNIEPWDTDKMLKTAEYFIKKVDFGTERDAIETAVTIACAGAINGTKIESGKLDAQIGIIDTWIKSKK